MPISHEAKTKAIAHALETESKIIEFSLDNFKVKECKNRSGCNLKEEETLIKYAIQKSHVQTFLKAHEKLQSYVVKATLVVILILLMKQAIIQGLLKQRNVLNMKKAIAIMELDVLIYMEEMILLLLIEEDNRKKKINQKYLYKLILLLKSL